MFNAPRDATIVEVLHIAGTVPRFVEAEDI